MRRSELLILSDLTNSEYDARIRREQLPFHADQSGGEGWARYSPFDAFLLELSNHLSKRGYSLAAAARHVRDFDLKLRSSWASIASGRKDCHFAVVLIEAIAGDMERRREPRTLMAEKGLLGPIGEILAPLSKLPAKQPVYSVAMVNASDVWRIVRERASKNGIDISDVFGDAK